MTVYKATFGIGQAVMGATESYYSADTSATVAAGRLQALINARNAMLYNNVYWTGVRVSQYGSQRRSTMLLPGNSPFPDTTTRLQVPDTGVLTKPTWETAPDQFRAVLQYLSFFDVDRSATRYLSNIPDSVSRTEPATVNFSDNPAWYNSFTAFAALLTSAGWQIRARRRDDQFVPYPIAAVVAQAASPFELGIRIVSMGAPTFTAGSKITLQKFRPPKGTRQKTVNGSWIIDSVDTASAPGYTTIYLRGSAGIAPADVRFTDTSRIQNVGYSLYNIVRAYYNRVGIHKRGRPLGSPAGRRLSRPSLDP